MSHYDTESITITIEMDNDSFVYDAPAEAARILRDLAVKIERVGFDNCPNNLKDYNGNTVGALSYHKAPE